MLKIFPWQKPKEFFTAEQREAIVEAIRLAEMRTSGEVRLYVESKCSYVDPLDRAKELFLKLKMNETELRNGTIIYVATKDRQAAIFGDEGIYQSVGQKYWDDEVKKMMLYFKKEHLVDGLIQVIADIGKALHHHFPYDKDTDKNELPDDIVFGK